jgi:hypothetical protein
MGVGGSCAGLGLEGGPSIDSGLAGNLGDLWTLPTEVTLPSKQDVAGLLAGLAGVAGMDALQPRQHSDSASTQTVRPAESIHLQGRSSESGANMPPVRKIRIKYRPRVSEGGDAAALSQSVAVQAAGSVRNPGPPLPGPPELPELPELLTGEESDDAVFKTLFTDDDAASDEVPYNSLPCFRIPYEFVLFDAKYASEPNWVYTCARLRSVAGEATARPSEALVRARLSGNGCFVCGATMPSEIRKLLAHLIFVMYPRCSHHDRCNAVFVV